MPRDPGEAEMVARVTSTLGLGHHSPASAKRDTSQREAGVAHWLQARATRGRRRGDLWRGSREDTGALFLEARKHVAAYVANTGTGGRGEWDPAYRWAQGPGLQPAPKASRALGPGAAGGAGAGGGASARGPLPSEGGTGLGSKASHRTSGLLHNCFGPWTSPFLLMDRKCSCPTGEGPLDLSPTDACFPGTGRRVSRVPEGNVWSLIAGGPLSLTGLGMSSQPGS